MKYVKNKCGYMKVKNIYIKTSVFALFDLTAIFERVVVHQCTIQLRNSLNEHSSIYIFKKRKCR